MLLVNVFVDFDQWARMGNRMFQYSFGYILAEKKNTLLYSNGLPNFGIPRNIEVVEPVTPIYTRAYGDHHVNMDDLMDTTRDIVVNSFVQKSKYYLPYRDKLRNVFSVQTPTDEKLLHKNKLVLHIRETDYTTINIFPGYDFYKKVINNSGFTDVVIVTDNSKCDTVQKLISDGCVLNSEGIVKDFKTSSDKRAMDDFFTLLYSENIAISQSSFSWWAAFLGKHKKVFFTFKSEDNGMWKLNPTEDQVDLFYKSPENTMIIV